MRLLSLAAAAAALVVPAAAQTSQVCLVAAGISIRVQALMVKGSAVSGSMTVRTGAKLRPVMYVAWTPTRLAVYASSDCTY